MVHFHLCLSGCSMRNLETCTYIISRPKKLMYSFIFLLPKLIIIIFICYLDLAKNCKGLQTAHQGLSMMTFPLVLVWVQHGEPGNMHP